MQPILTALLFTKGQMNEWCFKACRQPRSYWAHLHIKHQCEVEITYMHNNLRQT